MLLVAAALAACSPPPAPASMASTEGDEAATGESAPQAIQDPCTGGELQIEQIGERCQGEEGAAPFPEPTVLSRMIVDPGPVRAGSTVELDVRLENVSEQALPVSADVLDDMSILDRPKLFDAEGNDAQDPTQGNFAMGALMGPTHAIQVTLLPGGAMTMRVPIRLRRVRVSCLTTPCRELVGESLAPGTYHVVIKTPLVVRTSEGQRQLVLDRDLTVTP